MITTSGGGALVCEDDEAARRIKFLATQARESYPYYQHEEIGYNYRMSNICAGIGRGQMEVLDIHIAHHRHVQQLYREMLGGIKGITLHDNPSPFSTPTSGSAPPRSTKGRTSQEKTTHTKIATPPPPSLHIRTRSPTQPSRPCALPLTRQTSRRDRSGSHMHLQPVFASSPRLRQRSERKPFPPGDMPSRFGPWVSDEDVERIVATIASSIRI